MKPVLQQFSLHKPKTTVGQCAECAVIHNPNQPHNQQSLFYQYHFYEQHGRWPTWKDAMAHCSTDVKAKWTQALESRGIEVDP